MPKTPPSTEFEDSLKKAERRLYRLYRVAIPSLNIVLRYIQSDMSATVDVGEGSATYSAAPGIERDDAEQSANLETDTVRVTLPNESIAIGTLGSKRISEWARLGVFDDAIVDFYLWDRDSGAVMWDSRWFMQGNPAWNYEGIVFDLESLWARLDTRTPRTIIQETCNNKLYDPYCGLEKLTYRVVGTVDASPAPTTTAFNFSASASGGGVPAGAPDNYFALGDCEFQTGSLAPMRRMVYQQVGKRLVFAAPLPAVPTAGDTVWVYAGCDKTVATCKAKFNNLLKFRGFPYVPKEDSVYG